jgi:hypothetical protein
MGPNRLTGLLKYQKISASNWGIPSLPPISSHSLLLSYPGHTDSSAKIYRRGMGQFETVTPWKLTTPFKKGEKISRPLKKWAILSYPGLTLW